MKLLPTSFKEIFTTQPGFLLLATNTGYVFGYLYLVLVGRNLGPDLFGVFGSLVAVFHVWALIGQSLREAMASNIAETKARNGEAVAVRTFLGLAAKLSLLSLLPGAVVILFSQRIASFFHLNSEVPVVILGFSLITTLMLDIVLGLLQGLQKFVGLGINGFLISQGLKLLVGVALVWMGWGLSGAVAAMLVSTAIATMTGLVFSRRYLVGHARYPTQASSRLGPILVPTLILSVFLALPTSVDVMLVTHYFGATESGLYNAAATLGKIVFYLPVGVSFMLLPRAAERRVQGVIPRKMLMQSLAYAFVLSGGVALAYLMFADVIIGIFLGSAYAAAADLVSSYAVPMLLFSLNFVLMHYSLAIRRTGPMLLAAIVTLAETAAIVLVHQSLSQVIWIMVFGNLSIFALCFPYLAVRKFGAQ